VLSLKIRWPFDPYGLKFSRVTRDKVSQHKCYRQVGDALAQIIVMLPPASNDTKGINGLDHLTYVAGQRGLNKTVIDGIVRSMFNF
jgi:hypothetical protein